MEYLAKVTTEGRYILASFPDCPGCQTFVRKGEDIGARAQDALIGWLESSLDDGRPPAPRPPRPQRAARGERLVAIPVPATLAVRLELRWLRQRDGMTQAEVASSTGMTQQQIARLESGRANPTIETLDKLAHGLGRRLRIEFELPERPKYTRRKPRNLSRQRTKAAR